MSERELALLGTASQVPTRRRNHNGYLLRWEGRDVLFDPGEGTQRQLTFAGLSTSRTTHICLTHLHGDHCLGLPGIVQRMALEGVTHPVHLHVPSSGLPYVERLLDASISRGDVDVRVHPTDGATSVDIGGLWLSSEPLRHGVDTLGWRIDEPDGRRIDPARAAARGITGPNVGRLQREQRLQTADGWVTLEEVSTPRPGQSVAVVMDTAPCEGARRLADDVDLLVCESTYLARDRDLAEAHGHMTADGAGRLGARSGARRLVLTHFSQRYDDPGAFGSEAREHHQDVVVGEDLGRVALPARRQSVSTPASSSTAVSDDSSVWAR